MMFCKHNKKDPVYNLSNDDGNKWILKYEVKVERKHQIWGFEYKFSVGLEEENTKL